MAEDGGIPDGSVLGDRGIGLLATACTGGSSAKQRRTITLAQARARVRDLRLAVDSYNTVVASTRSSLKYCDLVSGTSASQ
jgi:hypothetical protein